MYADILLPVPLPGCFTYNIPSHLGTVPQVGCRVVVPFGKKESETGIVIRVYDGEPTARQKQDAAGNPIVIKDIAEVLDTTEVVLPSQLAFWQWIADYYLCTLGEVYKAALPAGIRRTKLHTKDGTRASCSKHEDNVLFGPSSEENLSLPTLSAAQQQALTSIQGEWNSHDVCLLHGVTSSGKTEIYTHLIAEAIRQGQQVLYLLPEIVLTSQLTNRLRAVFGDRLGVYHSKYTPGQRAEVWLRQLSDQPYDIIVGVRSSIFLPFRRLGLVIVDEEHETSFKQQEPAPRYHARNAAIMLAARFEAKTLLGTATPSLESYYNAQHGKYGLVHLTQRYGDVSLPSVEVVSLAEAYRRKQMEGPFTPQLLAAMHTALEAKEQVIIFQNRRGYAPSLNCHICGWSPRCPHCDVTLTLHRKAHRMTCHYCGYTTEIPTSCPSCTNTTMDHHGFGTERIEDKLATLFPSAHIARLDLDTTRTRSAYEGIIQDFSEGRTDILVGTQMVTKGLDFGRVSLVGILAAEIMLNQPDFRAYEHAYQMLQQVSGRAGRRERQGHVILQTFNPELPLLAQVVGDDYDSMYAQQMDERRHFLYPPFTRMVVMYFKHRQPDTVETMSRAASEDLRRIFGTRVLGPDEPPIPRVASLCIRRTILKLERTLPTARITDILLRLRTALLQRCPSAVVYFDVDPV